MKTRLALAALFLGLFVAFGALADPLADYAAGDRRTILPAATGYH